MNGAVVGTPQLAAVLTVAVPTFRRPREVARAVAAVRAQLGDVVPRYVSRAEVLVVDNDPAGSARGAVEALMEAVPTPGDRPGSTRYVVEPRPGVAAVRNRALEEAKDSDLLVFIDDDETPEPSWLESLLGLRASTGCQAVAGPVVPDYEVEPDAWVVAGEFFVRRTWPTGTVRPVAASNCLLLDLRFVREEGLVFDEAFGATGGEDTLFTRQLTDCGGVIRWCDEARVRDHVPASRLDHQWILRRQRSHAATGVRVALARAGTGLHAGIRGRALLGGALRVGAGGLRMAVGLLPGQLQHAAKGARLVARGQGMVGASLGRRTHEEYGRS
ncbi:glycosyltransferase [Actinomyces sp. 2119]|uniref:glycosyltransferase family 2 protein n=1 Tax=Actinomyces sp. 2119 TaxID=2321393 RepID=UPI000E6B845E|nr:glycosyltransferase family 2 protein [Actinomyces sp. 2119]RJF40998.1 glycosyltransferase [Actinomyces sp. 2119]